MTFSYLQVALICLAYLSILFTIAYSTEKGLIGEKIVSHPLTYIFSLGIFASAWAFYGVIDLARQYGYGALAYYVGTGALFLFAPTALKPLMELARRYQINSTADLLTFRYHSHRIGAVVTLCMLLAMGPLIALQMQAVADSFHLLTHSPDQSLRDPASDSGIRDTLAFVYCGVIACFAMMFGSNRAHHRGLITSMAFESMVKVTSLLAVGLFAVYQVFDGFSGLEQWLAFNPAHINQLHTPLRTESSHTLLLVFIATAVSMPHIFHMTVVENPTKHATSTVTWAFPLFLLVMALPIFPILWAGYKLGAPAPFEYYPVAIAQISGSGVFSLVAFVGGLSAATGAMIAISLSCATMIINHWILPASPLRVTHDIYGQIVWMRRVLISVVILFGYTFYFTLNAAFSLTELALTSFIATLQFLPGVIAVVHWTKANRRGLIAGLAVGMLFWAVGLLIPMMSGEKALSITLLSWTLNLGIDHWGDLTTWSLSANTIVFFVVSLFSKASDEELYSAELCSQDELSHPIRMVLDIRSPQEITDRLALIVGGTTAHVEVGRALEQLKMHQGERRPYSLRRLRDEVEANLSGLMGISMASEIMDRAVPYRVPEGEGVTDINLIESRVNEYRLHLTGLAAELNNLRLYHRKTFEELPMAACSVGQDLEILMWNSTMEKLTGIESERITGSTLAEVSLPWGNLLHEFSTSDDSHLYKQQIDIAGRSHWISLHKSQIPAPMTQSIGGQVILLEDVTEMQQLEQELYHSERLASVGRVAAGVAHEIGNPVTGIACLAQNLKYETEEKEVLETAEQILSQTGRVSRIVHSLVSFSHGGQKENGAYHPVNLHDCAQEAINLLALQKEKQQVQFENSIPGELLALGDTQKLIQVFVNLLSNSRDASEEGSLIKVEGNQRTSWVEFAVTDQGPGIPPEYIDRILEPFFTTKDPGEGTGLGLAMVYSIIEEHKGTLDIVSPVDKVLQNGTKFEIRLPAPHESSQQ
ncbi:MAG: PAS domain S-box protein [Cellvibrionaceae bacterium]|nr:PAS domain S-box protein [Cellvibrionaceae bacterium]